MQSLAVKYRPSSFNDVVEQREIKLILQEQLKTKTFKNAYLFTGGAGTGKTTCARIFANDINGGNGNPIEVDAASNNGVDNIRDIIDNAKFKSLDSPYKVYIIDEVHMLSIGAFNAMLKLLEEPPAQTIFIMCTTDPQKIPATILSRVQRYDFKRITFDSILHRLIYICEEESVEYDVEALEYIAKIADGGMRDSITLLDKCISYNNNLNINNVVQALGVVDYITMIALTEAIITSNKESIITTIETIHRNGIDLKHFMKQYSLFVLDLIKYVLLGNFDYLQIPSTYKNNLNALLMGIDCNLLYELLDTVIEMSNTIKWELTPKPYIESRLIIFTGR